MSKSSTSHLSNNDRHTCSLLVARVASGTAIVTSSSANYTTGDREYGILHIPVILCHVYTAYVVDMSYIVYSVCILYAFAPHMLSDATFVPTSLADVPRHV